MLPNGPCLRDYHLTRLNLFLSEITWRIAHRFVCPAKQRMLTYENVECFLAMLRLHSHEEADCQCRKCGQSDYGGQIVLWPSLVVCSGTMEKNRISKRPRGGRVC